MSKPHFWRGKQIISKEPAQLTKKLATSLRTYLPYAAADINVHGIRKFNEQGRSSELYSFFGTFTLDDSIQEKEFILRIYSEENGERGRKEFVILKYLKEENMPVPSVFSFEEKNNMFQKPFLIMEKINGKNASYFLNTEENKKFIVEEMAKCLANLHKIDYNCIEKFSAMQQQYEFKQKELFETRFFINKRCIPFLGFCPIDKKKFIKAVKQLGYAEPKKVSLKLIHLDYEPNHILVSNGSLIVVDWGEVSIGDPSYDVAWTYHKLRLGQEKAKVDLGEHFVNCYKKYGGQRLVNLQFFKDMVAIEMAKWCGLSPFRSSRARNYFKLLTLLFGDVAGEIGRKIYLKKLQRFMAGHHTPIWTNIGYIQNYALRYLDCERYE